MEGEVIKQFLVGLGFGIDEAGLSKFNKAISSATARVAGLAAATVAAATAVGAGILKISNDFEDLGYEYKLIAPAINKAIILRQEMFKAYNAAGINLTKVVQASVQLNMSITKTRYALEAIYKSVGSRFFSLLTKQSDVFRQKLYQNMPKIQAGLEKFVKFIFKALEAVTALGLRLWSILSRVYDFFAELHKATEGWSTIILAVVAAWRLLNLSFLATPLGALLTGLVALLALYDDFKTFQEGGKSFFDWTAALPVVNALTQALSGMLDILKNVFQLVWSIGKMFVQLSSGNFSGAFDSLKDANTKAANLLWNLVENEKNKFSLLKEAALFGGNTLNNLLGDGAGANAAGNIQGAAAPNRGVNPLGGNQGAMSNQNVNQQTQINVSGSADANAVGKAVAGEQNRVNFDMVRNMKGATR